MQIFFEVKADSLVICHAITRHLLIHQIKKHLDIACLVAKVYELLIHDSHALKHL